MTIALATTINDYQADFDTEAGFTPFAVEPVALAKQNLWQPAQVSVSENRLQSLLQALPAGVVVVDGKGQVEQCNAAAIELLGEPLLGESWRLVTQRSFRSIPSGQDVITNKERIVNISTCPLGANQPGQIVLLHDVTTNRQLQARVEQQSRLASMGKMAAQLAHQIRTPLASVLLYASHLKKNHLSEEHRLKFADKVLQRVHNLEQLIQDMLLFSKNGMEKGDVIALSTLLSDIANNQSLFDSVQYHIETPSQQELEQSKIFANHHLIVSALNNLIENAKQASTRTRQEEAKITIKSEIHDSFIDIKVIDNGSGMDVSQQEQIFEPFFTTKANGTGLGLPVVKAICQGHQGDVWLEYSHQQGSCFVMRLPKHP